MVTLKSGLPRGVRESIAGYLFILPNVGGVLILTILPVLFSLFISFTEWDLFSGINGFKFVGLKHYIGMWNDEWFTRSLLNNILYTFFTVPFTMLLAFILALILNKHVLGKNMLRAFFFMPHMTNVATISIIWIALYNQYGPIRNFLIQTLGMQDVPVFMSDPRLAMPCLIIMGIWNELGYVMMFFISGLQSIPGELYESADIDGANGWQKIKNVTIPMLTPTTFFVLITTLILSFKVFGQVNIMTQGGPLKATTVLVFYIYEAAFRLNEMSYASAMAWILFVIIFVITYVQWQKQKNWVNY